MRRGTLSPLERWRQHRDPEAFRELTRRHSGMVYGTCCRILGDRTEAEDVAQECFWALAKSDTVHPDCVGPWLHAVATRQALFRLRTIRRQREREARFASGQPAHTDGQPDDLYRHLDEAIEELPDELKTPLVAHYFEGETHAAIAKRLAIPRRTLSHRIRRAVKQVGNILFRRGIVVTGVALGVALDSVFAEGAPILDALSEHPTRTASDPPPTAYSSPLALNTAIDPPKPSIGSAKARLVPRAALAALAAGVALLVGVPLYVMHEASLGTRPAALGTLTQSEAEPASSDAASHSREAATPIGGVGGGGSGGGNPGSITPASLDIPDYSRYARAAATVQSGAGAATRGARPTPVFVPGRDTPTATNRSAPSGHPGRGDAATRPTSVPSGRVLYGYPSQVPSSGTLNDSGTEPLSLGVFSLETFDDRLVGEVPAPR